jgi:hypothetical protein
MELLTGWMYKALNEPSTEAAPPIVATPDVVQDRIAIGNEAMKFDPNVMPASFTPRDAFDPAIFNRRREARSTDEDAERTDTDAGEIVPPDESAEGVSSPSLSEES